MIKELKRRVVLLFLISFLNTLYFFDIVVYCVAFEASSGGKQQKAGLLHTLPQWSRSRSRQHFGRRDERCSAGGSHHQRDWRTVFSSFFFLSRFTTLFIFLFLFLFQTHNNNNNSAGNTALEEVVMAIKTRPACYPYSVSIVTTDISKVSAKVAELTGKSSSSSSLLSLSFFSCASSLCFVTKGMSVQPNKAIVGRNAFAHER